MPLIFFMGFLLYFSLRRHLKLPNVMNWRNIQLFVFQDYEGITVPRYLLFIFNRNTVALYWFMKYLSSLL